MVTGVGSTLQKTLTIYPAQAGILVACGDRTLLLKRKPAEDPAAIDLPIHCVLLTRVGREVFKILEPKFDISVAQELIKLIPKHSLLAEIRLFDHSTRMEGELLWEQPKPPDEQTKPG